MLTGTRMTMRRALLAALAWVLFRVGWGMQLSERLCDLETGPGSSSHEWALNRLNGKSIVLIGDSRIRFQYLELAYYLVHGQCPDKASPSYILTYGAEGFRTFFKESTEQLNRRTEQFTADEICMCHRLDLMPGQVSEQRVFSYRDRQVRGLQHGAWRSHPPLVHSSACGSAQRHICQPAVLMISGTFVVQGRAFKLMYMQYFNEAYTSIRGAFVSAFNRLPTDVVVSFGAWLGGARFDCVNWDARKDRGRECPSVPYVCRQFTKPETAGNAPKVWYMTTPPTFNRKQPPNIELMQGAVAAVHL